MADSLVLQVNQDTLSLQVENPVLTFNNDNALALAMQTLDGNTAIANVFKIKVPNGSLTDNGGGTVTLNLEDNIVQSGTTTGQMIYWNDTDGEWQYADVSQIKWDSVNGLIQFNKTLYNNGYTPTGTETTGTTYWDSDNHCLSSVYEWGAILQHGFELYKIGTDEGNDFPEGRAVSVKGASGNRVAFELTDASTTSTNFNNYVGLLTTQPDSGNRIATREGAVRGVNTTGSGTNKLCFNDEVWAEGNTIFVDCIHPGYLTITEPQAPCKRIRVGTITNRHATEGEIELLRRVGVDFTELNDVNGTPLSASGQIAVWDNVNKYFDFTANINNYLLSSAYKLADGTAQGQMLFWDNSLQKWTNTETTEMFWDDTNKRLGIGTATLSNKFVVKPQEQLLAETPTEFKIGKIPGLNSSWVALALTPENTAISLANYNILSDGSNIYFSKKTGASFYWRTNNANNGIIDASGNVGINTTTPRRKLDVLDASNPQIRWTHTDNSIYGELQVNASGITTLTTTGNYFNINKAGGGVLALSGTGASDVQKLQFADGSSVGAGMSIRYDSSANQLQFWEDTGAGNQKFYFDRANSFFVVGNPGINSTSIGKIFADGDIGVENADAGLWLVSDITGTTQDGHRIHSSSNKLSIDEYDVGVATNRLTIDTNGNVGIGTASPNYKLEIKDGNFYIQNSTAVNIYLKQNDYATPDRSVFQLQSRSAAFRIRSLKDDFNTLNAEILTAVYSGNVGINTTTPTNARLCVLDATNPQLSLEYSASVKTTIQTDSSGYLTITPSGGRVITPRYQASGTFSSAITHYGFSNDIDAGMSLVSVGNVGFYTGGVQVLLLDSNQEVKIPADNKKLYFGAGSDMSMYYDGTSAYLKSDEVSASDIHLTTGTAKTVVYDTAIWDDLNFDVARSGGVPATQPDYVTINNVVHREFTSGNNQLCGSGQELPHHYKLSSTIYPHLHLFLKSGESAGTTGVTFTFYWELRQSTGTTSGSVTLSATSADLGTTAGGNKFSIYDLTGFSGASELGGQLSCTIARTGGDAGDIVVTTYGVHYQKDTPGSRTSTTK